MVGKLSYRLIISGGLLLPLFLSAGCARDVAPAPYVQTVVPQGPPGWTYANGGFYAPHSDGSVYIGATQPAAEKAAAPDSASSWRPDLATAAMTVGGVKVADSFMSRGSVGAAVSGRETVTAVGAAAERVAGNRLIAGDATGGARLLAPSALAGGTVAIGESAVPAAEAAEAAEAAAALGEAIEGFEGLEFLLLLAL
jgi:hypothetical protein